MDIAKVTSKGQVTVPKAVREKLGLEAGSKIVFIQVGDDLVIRNAKSVAEKSIPREPMELYRLTPKSLPAFRRLQEAFEGFATEEGLETEDDVVEWIEKQHRDDDQ